MAVFHRSAFLAITCFCASASTALATGIRIADDPTLQNFTTMQAAIDAAQEGNLLLVQPGNYGAAIIDGKSLSIVAMPTGTPHMLDLSIVNLASAQKVLVSGITIQSADKPGVTLIDDSGDVRFQNCVIHGGRVFVNQSQGPAYFGEPGIDVHSCSKVVLTDCQTTGGTASAGEGDYGLNGGHGLEALDSNVVLYDCTLRGGAGSEVTNPGGHGGDACHMDGWGLFTSGCTFIGGSGGRSDYLGCDPGGIGGDGIEVNGSQAQVLDAALQPGAGGGNVCTLPVVPGLPIHNNGGVVNMIPGTRRKLSAAPLASDASMITLTVRGQPGDRFYFSRSFSTGYAYQALFHGLWALSPTGAAFARDIVPPTGILVMQVRTPDVVGPDHRLQVMQGFCLDAQGQMFLTSPVQVELFDAAGGPDCNANGINDFLDVITGTSLDTNQNSIPDGCPGG